MHFQTLTATGFWPPIITIAPRTPRKSYMKAFGLSKLGLGDGASATDAANNGCPSRKFVAGEKFWVTGIAAQKDGILVSTFSDPYPMTLQEIRFATTGRSSSRFVKGSVPPVDDFVKTVFEVITVQPADERSGRSGQPGQSGPISRQRRPQIRRLWRILRRRLRRPILRRRPLP